MCLKTNLKTVSEVDGFRKIEETITCPDCGLYEDDWGYGNTQLTAGWYRVCWGWNTPSEEKVPMWRGFDVAVEELRRLYVDLRATGFFEALKTNPSDIATKAAFSDWCEEHGYPIQSAALKENL